MNTYFGGMHIADIKDISFLEQKLRWNQKVWSRSSDQENLRFSRTKVPLSFSQNPDTSSYPHDYFIQSFLTWFFLTIYLHAILPSTLWKGLPKSLFPASCPTKILYTFLVSSIRPVRHNHLVLLNIATVIVCAVKWNDDPHVVFSVVPLSLSYTHNFFSAASSSQPSQVLCRFLATPRPVGI